MPKSIITVSSQVVERQPLGGFSKAAPLHAGLDKLTVASSTNEQLERQLYTLKEQLEIYRNQVAKARAKTKHFKRLYKHLQSQARS